MKRTMYSGLKVWAARILRDYNRQIPEHKVDHHALPKRSGLGAMPFVNCENVKRIHRPLVSFPFCSRASAFCECSGVGERCPLLV